MLIKQSVITQFILVCLGISIAQASFSAGSPGGAYWLPLAQDEMHDPADPKLNQLQNPAEALAALPREGAGDQVNWVKALNNNYIKPRINLRSNTQPEVLNLDVFFRKTEEMAMVKFPHKQHTEWLVCSNCHEKIFKSKAGADKFGMFEILNGEYCGRCHGAVAFPLTECARCHNVPRTPTALPANAN